MFDMNSSQSHPDGGFFISLPYFLEVGNRSVFLWIAY
jgi:hypothetical protein